MHTKQRTMAWVLFLIWMVPVMVFAGREGRLIGKVLDPEGNPIQGVIVSSTAEELPRYEDEDTSDKRGLFTIDFEKLFVVYKLRFQKAGYQTLESVLDWSLSGTEIREYTMYPEGTVAASDEPPASTSNAAILAFNAGVEAFRAKEFATAQEELQEALQHDPNLRQAWAALSLAHLEQRHHQEAVQAAEKAIALGSTSETVFRTRWEAYRGMGDEAKAAAALQDLEGTGRRAEEARRIFNEAVALLNGGDEETALARFKEALEVDPNLREALVGVATTGLELERYQEAAGAAETILAEDAHNEQALRIRFNAYLALKDEEKLVVALVGLAEVEPQVARDGLLQLAFAAYDANDMAKAKERFAKVLEMDPNHAQTHYYLGIVNTSLGASQEARAHLERFLQLAPEDAEADSARDMLEYLQKP